MDTSNTEKDGFDLAGQYETEPITPRRTPPLRRLYNGYRYSKYRHGVIYLFVACVLTAATVIGWMGYRSDNAILRFVSTNDTQSDSGLILVGQLTTIDLSTLTATILWTVGSLNSSGILTDPTHDFNLYQDGLPSPIGSYSAAISPYNPDQTFSSKVRIMADSILDIASNDFIAVPVPSTIKYPLDTYSIVCTFGAREVGTNVSLPIYVANLLGNIQGWETHSNDTAQTYVSTTWQYPEGRRLDIKLKRASAIIAFAMIIQAVMWGISLLMVYMAILGSIFGRVLNLSLTNKTPSLYSIPASVLFALPALRNVMPNAPPFGTYMDVCGLLLNEALVALSLIVMLGTHLSRSRFEKYRKKKEVKT